MRFACEAVNLTRNMAKLERYKELYRRVEFAERSDPFFFFLFMGH